MAIDELTPMVADEAGNLIEGDHVVNIGEVVRVNGSDDIVVVEYRVLDRVSVWPEPVYGKTYRADWMVVRWAREHEIEHDFDHNTEHGGEG